MIAVLLGGVGVFLVGMMLLSDGLRSAAGSGFRQALERFARTPFQALLSGTAFTALVQSSSATTLTTIGFVSAGLLTFPQAVGLIFGANLGTTSTAWLVSLLGFKVDVGAVALPLVGVGALLRFMAPGRWKHAGTALAGFGLIFVGIDILQDGMATAAERIRPEDLYGSTVMGRVALVAIGVVMTVVMQSSSAAVATTLTAIHAGGIGIEQGAYLVIGQNLGTSITAVLAAVGGSIPVRRTALAHVMFNGVTGLVALVVVPFLIGGALQLTGGDPTVAIAVFHTGFNLLGVAILFPVIDQFAALVERLVPEHRPSLTRNLDRSVAETTEVALEAARGSVAAVARLLMHELTVRLKEAASDAPGDRPLAHRGSGPPGPRVGEIAPALKEIRSFMGQVRSSPSEEGDFQAHLSVLHAVEHLERLEEIRENFSELGRTPPALESVTWLLVESLQEGDAFAADAKGSGADEEGSGADEEGVGPIPGGAPSGRAGAQALAEEIGQARAERAGGIASEVAEIRKTERSRVLEETAQGVLTPEEARVRIVHVLRMDRLAYHTWRALRHLTGTRHGAISTPNVTESNPSDL